MKLLRKSKVINGSESVIKRGSIPKGFLNKICNYCIKTNVIECRSNPDYCSEYKKMTTEVR